MDREILFRGKRVDNGEWVEGLPSYDIDGNSDSVIGHSPQECMQRYKELLEVQE